MFKILLDILSHILIMKIDKSKTFIKTILILKVLYQQKKATEGLYAEVYFYLFDFFDK
jgi:hypothetical protein